MSLTDRELKDLIEAPTDETLDGLPITTEYRGSGNHDVYIDGKYVGTAWYS